MNEREPSTETRRESGEDAAPLGTEVSHRAPRWARRFYSYFGFTSVLSELDD